MTTSKVTTTPAAIAPLLVRVLPNKYENINKQLNN